MKALSRSDSKVSFRSVVLLLLMLSSSIGSMVMFSGMVGVDGRERVSYSASR